MKIYNNLFDQICSFENLHLAYLKARKCKRYRSEILKFSYNLEENLLKLQEELLSQTYRHGGYREFIVCDSKKRVIKAAPFRDRVVHHALCNIIEPIFDKGFIYDSYACRKGKGTHKAIKRLESFWRAAEYSGGGLKRKNLFCLQCDVSKYFDSIDHKILLAIVKKKIIGGKTLRLLEEIINSGYSKKVYENLFDFKLTGIPVGNLTSQLFANIYLNELDQFVKHKLREKFYIRYMDDFLILSHDKKMLHNLKQTIKEFLSEKLALTPHPKKANIFPIRTGLPAMRDARRGGRGIDFLGYRIFGNYRLLRKSTIKRFVKRTKANQKKLAERTMTQEELDRSLRSWAAYAGFGDTRGLRRKMGLPL